MGENLVIVTDNSESRNTQFEILASYNKPWSKRILEMASSAFQM